MSDRIDHAAVAREYIALVHDIQEAERVHAAYLAIPTEPTEGA